MEKETFEGALLKLEKLVKELEEGEVDLENVVLKYKEAMELLKLCDKKLQSATQTVTKILSDDKFEDFEVNEWP